MKRFLLLLAILTIPINSFAENIDKLINNLLLSSTLAPDKYIEWQDNNFISIDNISNLLKINFIEAVSLNKTYPNIDQNKKDILLHRNTLLRSFIENNKDKIEKNNLTLCYAVLNIIDMALNSFDFYDKFHTLSLNNNDLYINIILRLTLSYILYNLDKEPNNQQIILEFTKIYIEKNKDLFLNQLKNKKVDRNYYNIFNKTLNELIKVTNNKYKYPEKINISNIKNNNGFILTGKWNAISDNLPNNIEAVTYYNLFNKGGTKSYNYINFLKDYPIAETFYYSGKNRDIKTTVMFFIEKVYIDNDIIYILLKQDPIDHKINKFVPLYMQIKFLNKNSIELIQSYEEGVNIYVNNIDTILKDTHFSLEENYSLPFTKKFHIKQNINKYFSSMDNRFTSKYEGLMYIGKDKYIIMLAYFDNELNFEGEAKSHINRILSIWHINKNNVVLKYFTPLDDGGYHENCKVINGQIECKIYDINLKGDTVSNYYRYAFIQDNFYLVEYKNNIIYNQNKASCSYYENTNKKFMMNKISKDTLKNLRMNAYNNKCVNIFTN